MSINLPQPLVPGKPVSATWSRQVVDALRAMQLQPGMGYAVQTSPQGTTLQINFPKQQATQQAVAPQADPQPYELRILTAKLNNSEMTESIIAIWLGSAAFYIDGQDIIDSAGGYFSNPNNHYPCEQEYDNIPQGWYFIDQYPPSSVTARKFVLAYVSEKDGKAIAQLGVGETPANARFPIVVAKINDSNKPTQWHIGPIYRAVNPMGLEVIPGNVSHEAITIEGKLTTGLIFARKAYDKSLLKFVDVDPYFIETATHANEYAFASNT